MALRRKWKRIGAIIVSILLYLQYRRTEETGTSSKPQVNNRSQVLDTVAQNSFVVQTTTKTTTTTRPQRELPYSMFRYPLDVDMPKLVYTIKTQGNVKEKPIFVYPYHNVLMPHCKCGCSNETDTEMRAKYSTQPFLLLLIKSAPTNFNRREAIRETWGNESLLPTFPTKRVFLIGRSEDKEIEKRILAEAQKYNDVLLLSYIDTYYNNTFKTIGGLNWAVKFCKSTKYVLFIDDDFYMNPVLLVKHLNTLSPEKRRHLFMGKLWYDIPQRGPHQKWYMPISVYPFKNYPPFISAGFMVLSMEFASDLEIAIQYTKKFKFDDVFLAIVVKKMGVIPQHHNRVIISKDPNITANSFKDILAHHRFGDTTLLKEAWEVFKQNFMT